MKRERLLKWYPAHWRARYGEELLALMDDTFGDASIPFSNQLAIMRAGSAERLRGSRRGDHSGERVLSGSLLVLCGWALVVIAGSAFAKMTEYWDIATPAGDRRLPSDAYGVVEVAAIVGLLVVVVAVAIALPAIGQFIHRGGWQGVRRPLVRALTLSAMTAALTVGMILWSRLHEASQHNGGRATHLVGSFWALLVVATLASCTFAAVVVARRLRFTSPVLRLEGFLAMALALALVAVIGGILTWSISIANDAPRLLSGSESGLFGLPGPIAEIMTGLLMFAGLLLALEGVVRVARAVRFDLSEGRSKS